LENVLEDETGFSGAVTTVSIERDGMCDVALARVPYLNIYGEAKEGRARLVVLRDRIKSPEPLPAFCHVHYEMGVDAARKWAKQGWAVFTAVYNEDAPIDVSPGDGNNLARAIIQWARRCPFIDGQRLHLDGASQGGYMVLAMCADMFPVTSATSDVPVVNWAYNFAYFEANRPLIAGFDKPFDAPLPVLAAVIMLADMAYEHFGNNLGDDTWYYLSPISKVNYVANPIMITCCTGDMLVPMEQMSRSRIPTCDYEGFPEGYRREFDALTLNDKARVAFEELLPPEQVFIHTEPLQENSYVVTTGMRLGTEDRPGEKPPLLDRKWSPEHQWSILYLNEGCVKPYSDHFTYVWNTAPESFVAHYRDAKPAPEILTGQKLVRLMERYDNAMSGLPVLKNGETVNRRNYDYLERRDVIAGLVDYIGMGERHESRLVSLYENCARKPLGDNISRSTLSDLLDTLNMSQESHN